MIPFPLRSSCCAKGKFLGDQGANYWPLWWFGDQDSLNDFAGDCMLSVSGAYFDGDGYYFDGVNDYLIDVDGRKVLSDGTLGTWSSILLTEGEVSPEGSVQGTGTVLYLNTSGTAPKITGKVVLHPEYCPNLTHLHFYNNNISVCDVSGLTSLTSLRCDSNNISVCDVSGLTSLTYFHCGANNISVLDVSALTSLTSLRCYNNNISVCDVSGLTSLTYFHCGSNNISVCDVSVLTSLTVLGCYGNNISVLDVSALTSLTYLGCDNNNMNSTMVDTVLCDMDGHGTSNGTLNISGNAVPGAAGNTAKANLAARGWAVTTD